jgi:hypothetical protein
MCSEIDARTRENPEAAMVQRPAVKGEYAYGGQRQISNPMIVGPAEGWDLVERARPNEIPGFDSAAHRAFMRSLG